MSGISSKSSKSDGDRRGRGHGIVHVVINDILPLLLWFVKLTVVGITGMVVTVFVASTVVRELGVFLAQTSGLAPEASTMAWVLGFVGPYAFVILMLVVCVTCSLVGMWRGIGKAFGRVAMRASVWYDARQGVERSPEQASGSDT